MPGVSDAASDATITSSNTILVTPTLFTGSNYVGFAGTFTGFSRFFLVDNFITALSATTVQGENNDELTVNNPFTSEINIQYSCLKPTTAHIILTDIMGRTVITKKIGRAHV